MIRKQILLTEELNEKLREKAFDERRSEAEIVREALEIYFNKEENDG